LEPAICDGNFSVYLVFIYFLFYHKIQVILKKQGDHTKANKSGEEAQKEIMGLIDIGLPQSKKIKLTVTVRPGSKVPFPKS